MASVHIVVVGCGRVGSELAMQLSDEGHSVVVIDKNRDSLRRLDAFNGRTLVGSGFDRDVLLPRPNAGQADALAAVTSGDNTNILCARIARDNYGIKNVVARIYDPQRAGIYMKLGIPTVATSLWTTQQVKRWMHAPSTTRSNGPTAPAHLHLVERIVPDALAGRQMHQLQRRRRLCASSDWCAADRDASTSTSSSPKRTTCLSSWSPPRASTTSTTCSRGHAREGRHRRRRIGGHRDRA